MVIRKIAMAIVAIESAHDGFELSFLRVSKLIIRLEKLVGVLEYFNRNQ
jgi:hypothetical protein